MQTHVGQNQVVNFVHSLPFSALPEVVVEQAKLCLLDLVGTLAAGSRTKLAQIITEHAAENFAVGRKSAGILLTGRRCSPVGAALAGGMIIDAFDAHDGHTLTKGHAGVAVLPALVAFAEQVKPISGREFLTALTIGYEIALRAGIATHRTTADYHTSGSWNTLGAAAIGCRLLGLDREQTRHAFGISEYHGPRSPMMRCVDNPTMLKDGSGWGAMGGVSAVLLARDDFTGGPCSITEDSAVDDLWSDLGNRWRILENYFKPYGVCRWAQPAIEAVRKLRANKHFDIDDINRITIKTFAEATRLASQCPKRHPTTTEEAQYSLAFPVAAFLAKGRLTFDELNGSGLDDPAVLRFAERMEITERADFSAEFPARRIAQVELHMRDGSLLESAPTEARGDPERALSKDSLVQKFRELTSPVLDPSRIDRLIRLIDTADDSEFLAEPLLSDLLNAPDTIHVEEVGFARSNSLSEAPT